MGKYGNSSLDFIDVMTLMVGLEGIHELNVELILTTRTQGHNGLLATTAVAWKPSVEAPGRTVVAQVDGSWPDGKRLDYANFAYNLLYELDIAIGRAYEQAPLIK